MTKKLINNLSLQKNNYNNNKILEDKPKYLKVKTLRAQKTTYTKSSSFYTPIQEHSTDNNNNNNSHKTNNQPIIKNKES